MHIRFSYQMAGRSATVVTCYNLGIKMLEIIEFGDDVLRQKADLLESAEILSDRTRNLVEDMQSLLIGKKLGIGLAAPQVGVSKSIFVIEIQKTEVRLNVDEYSLVVINPKILEFFDRKMRIWEGCISSGNGQAGLFAKVPRYKNFY